MKGGIFLISFVVALIFVTKCSGIFGGSVDFGCIWRGWSSWSSCSRSCGGGRQSRRRTSVLCPSKTEGRNCNNHCCPLKCWSQWSACTKTCGRGRRNRYRSIDPNFCEKTCYGSSSESQFCNDFCCPVNCQWNVWGSWESCSATCGGGISTRRRSIAVSSTCGGVQCQGPHNETRQCNAQCCPGVKCLVRLSAPMNGSINIPDKEFLMCGDKIRFSCDRGFRMEGSNESSCTASGEWSDPPPTCRIKYCPRPDALLNISRTLPPTFNETERPFNSVINIPCINKWYKLASGAAEWLCDDDEKWHPKDPPVFRNNNTNYPECQPICGKKNTKKQFFFYQPYGARRARKGEWPWMAFIDTAHESVFGGLGGRSFCGGSLVGEKHIVTAAHCVMVRIENLRVYLGVTNRFNMNNPNMQVFNVSDIYRHDEFRNQENSFLLFNHDIAVLRLDRPAVIGDYVRPICIPNSPLEVSLPEQDDKDGVVIGWSKVNETHAASILQVVRLPYMNYSHCETVYNNPSLSYQHHGRVRVTKNHFCAGFLDKVKDACDGDSGGPLMWQSNRKWYLNGIASFRTSLEVCGYYVIGVYTAVANYSSFIEQKISIV